MKMMDCMEVIVEKENTPWRVCIVVCMDGSLWSGAGRDIG